MFKKILIANRGEIACRVIKTARRHGIATVAGYSEVDATARHIRVADEAVLIGPSTARKSLLVGERILEVAKRTGAEAIHSCYGFLSENEEFAEAYEKAGVVFIGPPALANVPGIRTDDLADSNVHPRPQRATATVPSGAFSSCRYRLLKGEL